MTTALMPTATTVEEAAERRAAAAVNGNVPDGQSRSYVPNGQARRLNTSWLGTRRDAVELPPMPTRISAKKVSRDGKQFYVVEGYYTVYERGYEMWDWYGPYTEVVSAGAGEDTTAANPDVVFLVNHGGLAMARTHNANTLELWTDEVGGANRAWLNPERHDVQGLVANITDKVTTEQSFAFMITSGHWSPDYTEYRIDGYDLNRGDTSAVNFGANPYTSIAARSREILDELDHMPVGFARAAIDRLNRRGDLAQMTLPAPTMPTPAQMTPPPAVVNATGRNLADVDAWLAARGVNL